MKLPCFITSLSILFLLYFHGLLLPLQASEDSWRFIGTSMTNTGWYIDTLPVSTRHAPGEVVTVWVKSVPDPANKDGSRTETTEEIMRAIQEKYFGRYEHTEGLWTLDCPEKRYQVFYFIAFDKDGEIITSIISSDAAWTVIIPGSIGEAVAAAVCGTTTNR